MTSTRWCFTLNNPNEAERSSAAQIIEDHNVRYVIIGREVGASGTPHLQGFCILHRQQRLSWLRALIPRAHFERARGTSPQARDYCKKDGDFDEYGEFPERQGRRTDVDEFIDWGDQFIQSQGRAPQSPDIAKHRPRDYIKFPRAVRLFEHRAPALQLEIGEPRDWQVNLRSALEGPPDDRSIKFVIDPEGGKGKSWFCRWMLTEHPGSVQILGTGEYKDLAYMLDTTKSIFLFNLARGQIQYLVYGLLESLKDRMVQSGKYRSGTKFWTQNVHVVILSNEEPDMTKMTDDRYDLMYI